MLIASLIRLIGRMMRSRITQTGERPDCPLIRWDAGSPASGVQHSARHGASQPKVVHEDDVDEEVVELEVELPSEVRADCMLIAC